MPIRLDATYVDINNEKRNPVMLHRAILGSFERFIGILIEQYEAKFPIWLAPHQIILLSITDRNIEKCLQFNEFINNNGCLLYTSPSPRDRTRSRMPSSA